MLPKTSEPNFPSSRYSLSRHGVVGYHVRFTCGRSPVRTWMLVLFFFFSLLPLLLFFFFLSSPSSSSLLLLPPRPPSSAFPPLISSSSVLPLLFPLPLLLLLLLLLLFRFPLLLFLSLLLFLISQGRLSLPIPSCMCGVCAYAGARSKSRGAAFLLALAPGAAFHAAFVCTCTAHILAARAVAHFASSETCCCAGLKVCSRGESVYFLSMGIYSVSFAEFSQIKRHKNSNNCLGIHCD
jgi:hypothetical protein